jgi:hypothetical protein
VRLLAELADLGLVHENLEILEAAATETGKPWWGPHWRESQDAEAWLGYGIALLQTLEPGLDGIERQQQASQAFCKARRQDLRAGDVALAWEKVCCRN